MRVNKFKALRRVGIIYLSLISWSESLCMESDHSSSSEVSSQLNHIRMRPVSEEEVRQYPHNAVLYLKVYHKHNPPSFGTGFLIDNQIALTSAHVVFLHRVD